MPGQDRSLASGKPLKLIKYEFSLSGSQRLRCDPSTGCVRPLPQGCTEHTVSRDFSFHAFSNSTHFPFPSQGIKFHLLSLQRHILILYTLSCFFPTSEFLLPMGLPKPNKLCFSWEESPSVSSRSANCLCLLQTFFLKHHLNKGWNTGAHHMMAPPCMFLLLSAPNKYLHLFLTTATLSTRSTRSSTYEIRVPSTCRTGAEVSLAGNLPVPLSRFDAGGMNLGNVCELSESQEHPEHSRNAILLSPH